MTAALNEPDGPGVVEAWGRARLGEPLCDHVKALRERARFAVRAADAGATAAAVDELIGAAAAGHRGAADVVAAMARGLLAEYGTEGAGLVLDRTRGRTPLAGSPPPDPCQDVSGAPASSGAGSDAGALAWAQRLHGLGVTVLAAPPSTTNTTGFALPKAWEQRRPETSTHGDWQPGWCTIATTGVVLDVVDADPRHGADVDATRTRLHERGVIVLAEIATPRDGVHFVVPAAGLASGTSVLGDGLDYRGGTRADEGVAGGFVFAPGTARHGGTYRVLVDDLDRLPALTRDERRRSAAALHQLKAERQAETEREAEAERATTTVAPSHAGQGGPVPGAPVDDSQHRGGSGSALPRDLLTDGRIRRAVEAVRVAPPGSRNHALNKSAGTVAAVLAGYTVAGVPVLEVGEAERRARADLEGAARACGLEADDGTASVRATLTSGWRYGEANPLPPKVQAAPEVGELLLVPGVAPGTGVPVPPLPGVPAVGVVDPVELVVQAEAPPPSWEPLDVRALLDRSRQPAPSLLPVPGADAGPDPRPPALLAPRKVHVLAGLPGSAKTWVALYGVATVLLDPDGGRCAYVTAEDDPADLVDRLRMLGAPIDVVAERLDIITPDADPTAEAERAAWTAMLASPYTLVVLDTVGEMLALAGANENNNVEVKDWFRRVPRALASATGAAVICVDHLGRPRADTPTAGRKLAIGSIAKQGATDIALVVSSIEGQEPSRGVTGAVTLEVTKYRSGHWRKGDRIRVSIGPDLTSALTLDLGSPPGQGADDGLDDQVVITLTRVHAEVIEDGRDRRLRVEALTAVMQYLAATGEPVGVRQVERQGPREAAGRELTNADRRHALEILATRGMVEVVGKQARGDLYAPASGWRERLARESAARSDAVLGGSPLAEFDDENPDSST